MQKSVTTGLEMLEMQFLICNSPMTDEVQGVSNVAMELSETLKPAHVMNHTCIIASSKAKSYESEVFYADSIMRSRFVHSYEISDKVLVNTLKIVCCIVSMPTRQHEVSFQDGISFTAAPMFYISRVPSLLYGRSSPGWPNLI
ncbi:unnamed protein product [Microthlaspi erraticum]|uniref:Uncharacterized protein n=1 Tax=Microthlaspi erraticum TaxID=1685480 RepID=A0A6D2KBS4_9BRAS|nr:unnamed protein product [Microthlaspi erraticum]